MPTEWIITEEYFDDAYQAWEIKLRARRARGHEANTRRRDAERDRGGDQRSVRARLPE